MNDADPFEKMMKLSKEMIEISDRIAKRRGALIRLAFLLGTVFALVLAVCVAVIVRYA